MALPCALAPPAFRCGRPPVPRKVRLFARQTATSAVKVVALISTTSPSLTTAAAWLGVEIDFPGPTDNTFRPFSGARFWTVAPRPGSTTSSNAIQSKKFMPIGSRQRVQRLRRLFWFPLRRRPVQPDKPDVERTLLTVYRIGNPATGALFSL